MTVMHSVAYRMRIYKKLLRNRDGCVCARTHGLAARTAVKAFLITKAYHPGEAGRPASVSSTGEVG